MRDFIRASVDVNIFNIQIMNISTAGLTGNVKMSFTYKYNHFEWDIKGMTPRGDLPRYEHADDHCIGTYKSN